MGDRFDDYVEAAEERERLEKLLAIDRVEAAANAAWRIAADLSIEEVAKERITLTSEDVREHLAEHYPDVSTRKMRAMGPVMQRAFRAGMLEPIGYVEYRRGRHQAPTRLWRSRVHDNEEA